MRNIATQEQADLTHKATMAVLTALETCGASNDPSACMAAIGAAAGCIAANVNDPAEAMRAMNAVAEGIIDGTLVA